MHNNSMVETIIELKMKIAERYKKEVKGDKVVCRNGSYFYFFNSF